MVMGNLHMASAAPGKFPGACQKHEGGFALYQHVELGITMVSSSPRSGIFEPQLHAGGHLSSAQCKKNGSKFARVVGIVLAKLEKPAQGVGGGAFCFFG